MLPLLIAPLHPVPRCTILVLRILRPRAPRRVAGPVFVEAGLQPSRIDLIPLPDRDVERHAVVLGAEKAGCGPLFVEFDQFGAEVGQIGFDGGEECVNGGIDSGCHFCSGVDEVCVMSRAWLGDGIYG